ncbi:MAG TPA: hypothetical protein VK250_01135 [Nitrososphaeraceae archaeon]|jgi:hypothetical protein|nr:hypothetical protein [Nitrososphaeraceae archaeon]
MDTVHSSFHTTRCGPEVFSIVRLKAIDFNSKRRDKRIFFTGLLNTGMVKTDRVKI